MSDAGLLRRENAARVQQMEGAVPAGVHARANEAVSRLPAAFQGALVQRQAAPSVGLVAIELPRGCFRLGHALRAFGFTALGCDIRDGPDGVLLRPQVEAELARPLKSGFVAVSRLGPG